MECMNVENLGPRVRKLLLTVLLSLSATVSANAPASAQTEFQILGQPVLTIRQPEGDTEARVRQIEDRFADIVDRADEEQLEVSVEGNQGAAQISINGSLLLRVTAEDAAANNTGQAVALADVWGDRLKSILKQPQVARQLFKMANLPEQIVVAGRRYVRLSDAAPDRGQFLTDGSRADDRVIFWESQMESDRDELPNPPPEKVYVLNRFREFIPYRAI